MQTTDEDRARRGLLISSVITAGLLYLIVRVVVRWPRQVRALLNRLDQIDKAGAKFRSVGDPAWDTTTPTGRLLATLLAGIAEFERELIASGLAKAASVRRRMA